MYSEDMILIKATQKESKIDITYHSPSATVDVVSLLSCQGIQYPETKNNKTQNEPFVNYWINVNTMLSEIDTITTMLLKEHW